MYWLLDKERQGALRAKIDKLVIELSNTSHKPPHSDQIFPFQGRKAITHAQLVINVLTEENDSICDPFVGSGSFGYAAAQLGRKVYVNEYEPYTFKISSAPFKLPPRDELTETFSILIKEAKSALDYYYRSKCVCGEDIVIDSLFFDRVPLNYSNVEKHERLGRMGENITFRGKHKCKNCGAESKHFDDADQSVLDEIESISVAFPQQRFIENSRINLTKDFLEYESLFPKRSQVVSTIFWGMIQNLKCSYDVKNFIECTFLSIVPLMKYKDYRSKSQDLHCPRIKLRETNILNSFEKQFSKRVST
ncbi:MAG: hypothetical protein ACI91R_002063, partial [Vicingaceae bacterium]